MEKRAGAVSEGAASRLGLNGNAGLSCRPCEKIYVQPLKLFPAFQIFLASPAWASGAPSGPRK
jgi:hypothetical protein